MCFKTILPINKPIIFCLVIVFVSLMASQKVDARPRRVNKLLIIYNNGKQGIAYTVDRPTTYISSHGGPAVIKRVRLLKSWFIDDCGSLYGKNLKTTEPNAKAHSTPKTLAQTPSTTNNSKSQSQNTLVTPRHKNLPPKSSESTLGAKRRSKAAMPGSQLTKDANQPKDTSTVVRSHRLPKPSESTPGAKRLGLSSEAYRNQGKAAFPSSQLTKDANQSKDTSTIVASKTLSKLSPAILKRIARYEKSINLYAKKYKLEPNLLKAVIYVESSGNPDAVSNKGAKGLMQLMDDTAEDMNVKNVFNPIQNIEGGAKYLRQQLNTFQNNLSLALAAYNSGPRHVKRKVFFRETKKYVKKVIAVKMALSLQE